MKLANHAPLWLLLALLAGCNGGGDSAVSSGPGSGESADSRCDELFTYAIDNLNRLEEFESGAMIQQILQRLKTSAPAAENRDALMQTWPEPEMLRQITGRLNQWIRSQDQPPPWKPDPIVSTLGEGLDELPHVKGLGEREFSAYDGFALREAVWLRDVSNWARGEELADLERAKRLFDWTVRNIQLQSDNRAGRPTVWIPQMPWETLLFGRGTAVERAWVFILLARQQGLDAAMLAIDVAPVKRPPPDQEEGTQGETAPQETPTDDSASLAAGRPGATLLPWVVGVLIGGKVYLFDPALGVPIPAPEGVTLDDVGQLDVQPATLAQVIADDALLRRLDIGESSRYPVKASALKRVVALVEASPMYLGRRMGMIESRLAGEQKAVLNIDATAQAARFANNEHIAEGRLWTHPYDVLLKRSQLRPELVQQRLVALLPFYGIPGAPLRKARILYLGGELTGPRGAAALFLRCRPPTRELAAAEIPQIEKAVYLRAKQNASYWLGLIAYERGNYSSATHYFATLTLEAWLSGPWTHGAVYNLARTHAAAGRVDEATRLYRSDPRSPAHFGNLLRARWLEEIHSLDEESDTEAELKQPDF